MLDVGGVDGCRGKWARGPMDPPGSRKSRSYGYLIARISSIPSVRIWRRLPQLVVAHTRQCSSHWWICGVIHVWYAETRLELPDCRFISGQSTFL